MSNEAEVVSKVLSQMNGARYGRTQPRPDHLGEQPKWYVSVIDGAYERFAHASTVWADGSGTVWVESVHLGSPTSWAEEEYGEKGAIRVMDIDYRHLSLAQVQARLTDFPRLHQRIEKYRRVVDEVSGRSRIPLQMVFDARVDMGWFLFRAHIRPKAEALEGELRKAVAAMKELYDLTESAHRRELLSSS